MPDYVELPSNALGITYGGNEYYPKSQPSSAPRQRKGIYRECTLHKSKYAFSPFLSQLGIMQKMYLRRVRDGHSEIQWAVIMVDGYGHHKPPQFMDTVPLTLKLDDSDFINTQNVELSAIIGYEHGHTGSSEFETANGRMKRYPVVDVVEASGISQWEAVRNLNASKRTEKAENADE